jgi:hypothetical protein
MIFPTRGSDCCLPHYATLTTCPPQKPSASQAGLQVSLSEYRERNEAALLLCELKHERALFLYCGSPLSKKAAVGVWELALGEMQDNSAGMAILKRAQ